MGWDAGASACVAEHTTLGAGGRPGDKWAGEGVSCAGTSPAAGDSLVYFRVAVTTVVMGIEPLRQGGRASSDLSGCSDTHQAGNNNMPQLGHFSVGGVT